MNARQAAPPPCRSVFRAGPAGITKESYTRLWAALISQMERSREILAGVK